MGRGMVQPRMRSADENSPIILYRCGLWIKPRVAISCSNFVPRDICPSPVVDEIDGTSDRGPGMEADISLMELLKGLHDPRGALGRRHPFPPSSAWPSSPCPRA